MKRSLILTTALATMTAVGGTALAGEARQGMSTTSDEPMVDREDVRQSNHETEAKFEGQDKMGKTSPHPVFVFSDQERRQAEQDGQTNVVVREFEPESVRQMVTFNFDSAQLTAKAQQKIDRFADLVQEAELQNVEVYGHTDTVDTDAYNAELSEDRAEAVAAALKAHGVETDKIGQAWFGETEPLVETGEGERNRLNRRVVLVAGDPV